MRLTAVVLLSVITFIAAQNCSINGCEYRSAADFTGKGSVTITFGPSETYDSACIRVDPNTNIIFSGSFNSHPLVGGDGRKLDRIYSLQRQSNLKTLIRIIEALQLNPDPNSPIPTTVSGTNLTVYLNGTNSVVPYYCEYHAHTSNMYGAIYVGTACASNGSPVTSTPTQTNNPTAGSPISSPKPVTPTTRTSDSTPGKWLIKSYADVCSQTEKFVVVTWLTLFFEWFSLFVFKILITAWS